ncbi:hypothetical protein FALCPG4_018749 [Fusarium falciforme]
MPQSVVDIPQLLRVRNIWSPVEGEYPGRANLVDQAGSAGSTIDVLVAGFIIGIYWFPYRVPPSAYIEPLAQRC